MHRPTVLLVDPDDDNRTMYALYLQTRGFLVATAVTVEEGLLKASQADVVVTGTRLAGVADGIDFVQQLRTRPFTTRLPIVVLTACALPIDHQRALAAGCNVFLTKPCLPDRLEREIRLLLSSRHLPRHRHARQLPGTHPQHRKAS